MTATIQSSVLNTQAGQAALMQTLTYICYAHNRDQGMTADQLARLFPETGATMEGLYLADQFEEAGRRG